MTEPGPEWAAQLGGQAQEDQALAAIRLAAVMVATFYRTLRQQGVPREVAAGLTANWHSFIMESQGQGS